MTFRIYIGWDSREPQAADVCQHSILKHASGPVDIILLKQADLRACGLYYREPDKLASTEFSLTRFLVPCLNDFQGWALFVDCDFLFQADVYELLAMRDPSKAVQVVQHDYQPRHSIKMDGQTQHLYPKKNWSSLILWNCGHPDNAYMTKKYVNSESPSNLHQFRWLGDHAVGSLSHEWNWLVNWYHEPQDGHPKAIHYTEGGPWFEKYLHTEYGAQWIMAHNEISVPRTAPSQQSYLEMVTDETRTLFDNIIKFRVDPLGHYYGVTRQTLTEQIEGLDTAAVAAINIDEGDTKFREKGKVYDPILQSFVQGAGGRISNWNREESTDIPLVLRGVTKRKEMRACQQSGRDFYYIDTGYFGNVRKKTYHRVTKNNVQNFGPVVSRPRDRLAATGVQLRKFRGGRNILLAPPSQKLLNLYDIDLEQWLAQTIEQIRSYTDRPVVTRLKQSRSVRQTTDTIEMALEQDVHCLVTFSSIAAVEALLLGKPAITLGPNAAAPLCSQTLAEIENPRVPTLDEVEEWAAHLAYCQFTEPEMRNGTAWRILQGA